MKTYMNRKFSLIILFVFCSILLLSNPCFARRIKADSNFTDRQVAWGILFCESVIKNFDILTSNNFGGSLTRDEKLILQSYLKKTLNLNSASEYFAESRNMSTTTARTIIVGARIAAKYELHMLGITSVIGYLTDMDSSRAEAAIIMDKGLIHSSKVQRILQEAKELFDG